MNARAKTIEPLRVRVRRLSPNRLGSSFCTLGRAVGRSAGCGAGLGRAHRPDGRTGAAPGRAGPVLRRLHSRRGWRCRSACGWADRSARAAPDPAMPMPPPDGVETGATGGGTTRPAGGVSTSGSRPSASAAIPRVHRGERQGEEVDPLDRGQRAEIRPDRIAVDGGGGRRPGRTAHRSSRRRSSWPARERPPGVSAKTHRANARTHRAAGWS